MAFIGTPGNDRRHRDVRNLDGPDCCTYHASGRTAHEGEGIGHGCNEPAIRGPNMTTTCPKSDEGKAMSDESGTHHSSLGPHHSIAEAPAVLSVPPVMLERRHWLAALAM